MEPARRESAKRIDCISQNAIIGNRPGHTGYRRPGDAALAVSNAIVVHTPKPCFGVFHFALAKYPHAKIRDNSVAGRVFAVIKNVSIVLPVRENGSKIE